MSTESIGTLGQRHPRSRLGTASNADSVTMWGVASIITGCDAVDTNSDMMQVGPAMIVPRTWHKDPQFEPVLVEMKVLDCPDLSVKTGLFCVHFGDHWIFRVIYKHIPCWSYIPYSMEQSSCISERRNANLGVLFVLNVFCLLRTDTAHGAY